LSLSAKEQGNFTAMNKLTIEVAYAKIDCQRIIKVMVDPESSVLDAIQQSGILKLFPEIDLTTQKVGIFSKHCGLSSKVNEGDRIEIYRPLSIDPKEARMHRAKIYRNKKLNED
jgi:putative ubiquitin-RnfH superfamily antitoxin RatB of RatAB toxin-antitoxin module